jgi:aminoglycoside phosphotransferase
MDAGPLGASIAVPACVTALAAGGRVRPVWRNELDGLTFEVGDDPDRCFVKWSPRTSRIDLSRERVRLAWAARHVRVPAVLGHGADADGTWLVTRALRGESAVAERWLREPERAVHAIGAGLRAFHDSLPVAECPFTWSLDERLADVRRRALLGTIEPSRWHADHRHLDLQRALAVLEHSPAVDRLVVCQGDACSPNTLIGDDGECAGHVDLGALGVADRWADLAIASWSTRWNYGHGWERALLAAYGVEPDESRTHYYRLLWDLGP